MGAKLRRNHVLIASCMYNHEIGIYENCMCVIQNSVMIGSTVDNSVNYILMLGSLNFTGVNCSATNNCSLRVTGSQLTVDSLLNVSVVAFNAVGSGPPASSATPGG